MTATTARPRSLRGTAAVTVAQLRVDELTVGADFRLDEDVEALSDLSTSIAKLGVLQPLVVRPAGSGWEVVAGRRRLAAARAANLTHVPCIVRDLDIETAVDVALAENLHRRSLSAVEEGLAYAQLRDQGLRQYEIAHRVGRTQSHVSKLLRVLELPAELRDKIHRRELSYATALDRWGRKRFRDTGTTRKGGESTTGHLSGRDAGLATYWRRRHDRLIGALRAVIAQKPGGDHEWRSYIDRVLKLDMTPFPETER